MDFTCTIGTLLREGIIALSRRRRHAAAVPALLYWETPVPHAEVVWWQWLPTLWVHV